MTFLEPLALAGLITLPVILILHMLQARRRRMTVSSIALWRDLPRPTRGTRRRRLPLTLLLLLHLLVAALLVAALARPRIERWLPGQPLHTIILLDTTTSMKTLEGDGTRFDRARAEAYRLIGGLASNDTLTLITLEPQPRILAAGDAADRASLTAALAALAPGMTGADLAAALNLANGAVDPTRDNRIVVLSDAALAPANRRDLPTVLAAPVLWPSLATSQSNQALVSASARHRPDGQTAVFARIANYGNTAIQRRLQLFADGDRLSDAPVQLKAEGEVDQVWTVPAGVKMVEARLGGADALPADDRAFLSLEADRRLGAVVVGQNTDALVRALKAIATLRVTTVPPASYSPAPDTELTVFEGYLPPSLPPGGVIIVNPPADSLFKAGGPRLNLDLDRADDPLVSGLDLAAVHFNDVPKVTPPAWARPAVSFRDHPLVARGQTGVSRVVAFTFDLKTTNLPTKLAFPILLARAVGEVTRAPLPPTLLSGQPLLLSQEADRVLRVSRSTDSGERPVPMAEGGVVERTQEPGLYTVTEMRGSQPTVLGHVAVHAGSALESDVRPQPLPQFQVVPPGDQARADTAHREVWFYLAVAALAVLSLEALVARR